MNIHRASMETANFDFEAFGATKKEARAALKEALAIHGQQYKLPPNWDRTFEKNDTQITLGMPYRDSEPMRED